MSSLSTAEKLYLENILGMGGGYVLAFSDATFGQFFDGFNVKIHSDKYQIYGVSNARVSKAKKMRAFWDMEPDALVGEVLSELLDVYEARCDSIGLERDTTSLRKSRDIVARLMGRAPQANPETDKGFLDLQFEFPNIQMLPIESLAVPIVQARLKEAQDCLSVGAHLSVIFQCGSVLEGVLLGAAQKEPKKFNRSSASPKNERDGKVKAFHEWSLSEFINVAHDIGLLKPDVQKFSHGLRDFRNYIHPYQQMNSGFTPDEHTARVCLQVLKAALADVAGER